MNIFSICFYACLTTTCCLYSAPSGIDRDWENWQKDDVAEVIHNYWIHSSEEVNHRQALAQLVKSLYLPNERFLEAGCGSGLVYKELVPNIMDNTCYLGIDITQKMLSIAHGDYPNGAFFQDDLYNLSFEDNSIEIVAAFEVLGHLRHIEIPLREMMRVASRLVVFTVWTGGSTQVTEERFRNSQFIHTTFSHADIMQAIENAANRDHTVKAIPFNEHISAYIVSLESKRV